MTPATPAGASPLHMSVALPFARELHNNLSMLPDKIVSQQGMDDWYEAAEPPAWPSVFI